MKCLITMDDQSRAALKSLVSMPGEGNASALIRRLIIAEFREVCPDYKPISMLEGETYAQARKRNLKATNPKKRS